MEYNVYSQKAHVYADFYHFISTLVHLQNLNLTDVLISETETLPKVSCLNGQSISLTYLSLLKYNTF